jgi:hypothetical protein
MKEGPSGSAIRSLIPSHRDLLRSKAVVMSGAEMPGQRFRVVIGCLNTIVTILLTRPQRWRGQQEGCR